jgi:hypothetical protein
MYRRLSFLAHFSSPVVMVLMVTIRLDYIAVVTIITMMLLPIVI